MRDRAPSPPAAPPRRHKRYRVGRRKRSVARVLIQPGNGNSSSTASPSSSVSPRLASGRDHIAATLTNRLGTLTCWQVLGGGVSGQAGAIVHATAELTKADESNKQVLREAGLLTRDAREKGGKKYGLKKRVKPQYTKR